MTYMDDGQEYTIDRPFEGVIPNMQRRFMETESSWVRDDLGRFQSNTACETCNGMRLRPQALAVKLDGLHISDVGEFSILEAKEWFAALPKTLTPKQDEIAGSILKAGCRHPWGHSRSTRATQ